MAKETKEPAKYSAVMTQSAENDLNEIITITARDNPRTALETMEKLQAKINTLNNSPNRGTNIPELLARNIPDYRQLMEEPWKIIYKVEEKTVNILAIIDSRRNLQDVLIRKLLK